MRHNSRTAWAHSSRESRSTVKSPAVWVVAVVALSGGLAGAGVTFEAGEGAAPSLLQLLKCRAVELTSSGTFLPFGEVAQVISAPHRLHSLLRWSIFQPCSRMSWRSRYSRLLPAIA